jgi:GAF domain-containing protein
VAAGYATARFAVLAMTGQITTGVSLYWFAGTAVTDGVMEPSSSPPVFQNAEEALKLLLEAGELDRVMAITRQATRQLTLADGVSFILREGDQCHYADEDAISPLWKGRRFPQSECVSGWCMRHAKLVAIDDIYSDPRVPWDAYRPTFVKSLLLAPIRHESPIGALGLYWAQRHRATSQEITTLKTLAHGAGLALASLSR